MRPGSKQFWTKINELLSEEAKTYKIPALKAENGEWMISPSAKANDLAKTFSGKCEPESNRFTVLKQSSELQWNLIEFHHLVVF